MGVEDVWYIEVATYIEKDEWKVVRNRVGLLARREGNWEITYDPTQAHGFKSMADASAIRSLWKNEYPEMKVGVRRIGDGAYAPQSTRPPNYIVNGLSHFRRNDEHEMDYWFAPKASHQTCIWCGEEFLNEDIDQHETDCTE